MFSAMPSAVLHIQYVGFVLSLQIVVVKLLFENLMCFQSFLQILNSSESTQYYIYLKFNNLEIIIPLFYSPTTHFL